jgi:polyadenylate-binding protein
MATAAPVPSTPYASASLYVGDLLSDVTEALLYEIFNAVGPVASVRVCRDGATRRSLGYAYVNFHRVDDAERALDTMNFKNIRHQPCRIMWSHRDPSLRRSGLGNIFVKGLAAEIDNKQLYDTFSMFGNILSCKVATNSKRESLGYGFVHYESEEAAQDAIERVNGKVISNHKVTVSAFKSKKERGGPNKTNFTNVYVKNFPEDWTKEKLDEVFSEFGKISSSAVATEGEKNKGFGFVAFEAPEVAAAAVAKMNGFKVSENHELYVVRAQKKEEREKELRDRFEKLKLERQQKYAGVNLYVKNLADDTDDDKLRSEFSHWGSITSARVMRDQQTGKSKGFGFVCFSTPEEATKCVTEMNGRMLDQKPLYVALAQRKDVRRAHLEAQHAQRAKLGPPQPHMYGPQGGPGPMYYQGMQRNFVYPQPMLAAQRWGPNQMLRHPGMQYQLMPMSAQQRPGQGPPAAAGAPPNGRRGPKRAQGQGPNAARNNQREAGAGEQVGAQTLTVQTLAAAPEAQRKQMIGERLFPLIRQKQPELAGKITGMLLEMENGELLILLEDGAALDDKIEEALTVLREHQSS